jgi:hypothetical protein
MFRLKRILRRLIILIIQLVYYPFNKSYRIIFNSGYIDLFESANYVYDFSKYYPNGLHGHAWVYGHFYSILKYASYNGHIKDLFIQGAMVSDALLFRDSNPSSKYIVMSEMLKKQYINLGVKEENILAVGPYIFYADEYYNQQKVIIEKKRLGKTLVVFFPHTRKDEESIFIKTGEFTVDNYKKSIEIFESNYDSIIGVFHYYDLDCDFRIEIEKLGVKTVTAGHPKDPLFLSRLRSIILLGDFSLSYNISTHVGYCIALGLPHQVIEIRPGVNDYYMFLNKDLYPTRTLNSQEKIMLSEARLLFNSNSESITNEQYNFVNEYFGLDQLKSPSDIKFFLSESP